MDPSLTLHHRPPAGSRHTSAAAPVPTPPADVPAPGAAQRQRVLPPEGEAPGQASANEGTGPPGGPGFDLARICKQALVAGGAFGLTFGSASAVNNALRALPGVPLPVKLIGACLPGASLLFSPHLEDRMREALDCPATYPPEPSLAHDVLSPVALTLMNLGYQKGQVLKLPPATLPGMAAVVFKTALASVPAGGASEADAQRCWRDALREGRNPSPPQSVEPLDKGIGRVRSQALAAVVNMVVACKPELLQGRGAVVPMLAVTTGWTFRRELMPAQSPAGLGSSPAAGRLRDIMPRSLAQAASPAPQDAPSIPPA